MNNPLLNKLNKDLKFVYSDNDTLSIIFNNNEILMGVVGEFNNNLKELEKITETKIYSRGNSILVKSSSTKNELVKNAIIFLTDQLILNGSIEKKDIISSINKFMINEKTDKKIEYIIKTPKKISYSKIRETKKLCKSFKRKRYYYFLWSCRNREKPFWQ